LGNISAISAIRKRYFAGRLRFLDNTLIEEFVFLKKVAEKICLDL